MSDSLKRGNRIIGYTWQEFFLGNFLPNESAIQSKFRHQRSCLFSQESWHRHTVLQQYHHWSRYWPHSNDTFPDFVQCQHSINRHSHPNLSTSASRLQYRSYQFHRIHINFRFVIKQWVLHWLPNKALAQVVVTGSRSWPNPDRLDY